MYSNLIGLIIGLFGTSMFLSEVATFMTRHKAQEWQRTLEHRQQRKGH